jgi:hypothetical protein
VPEQVFISYRRQDSTPLAHSIKDRLERKNISVFLDVEDLDGAGLFPERLSEAIAQAKVFICLLGPTTLTGGDWVRREIELACRHRLVLIPVFQPGFDPANRPVSPCVQHLLENQGIKIPSDDTLLGGVLNELVKRVQRVLKPRIPCWVKALAGLVAGLIVGVLLVLLFLTGDGDDCSPPPVPEGAWETNLSDGDHVARTVTFIAENDGHVEGDVWVFVVPSSRRLHPQSENPCQGEGTFSYQNKWEVRVGLGADEDIDSSFDIVVTVADTPRASEFIALTLKGWCQKNEYPGFEALPAGLREVHRVRGLIRTAGLWGPAPTASTAQVGGQVTITSPTANAVIPETAAVSGTYLNPSGDVWVLVFTSYGRWFPQSELPCTGPHTRQEDGVWEVPNAQFSGGADKPFDVIAVLADGEASAFFADKQRFWCEAGFYAGYRTIELPTGIEEKDRIRVYGEPAEAE